MKKVTLLTSMVLMLFISIYAKADSKAAAVNLAAGKPASCSSFWGASYTAEKAFDGNANTRWSAAKTMTVDQWLQVDLETSSLFDRIVIQEYNSRVTSYSILVSDDATDWTEIYIGENIISEKEIVFDPVTARYMKINIATSADVPSIYEIGVFYQKSAVTLPEIGSGMLFEEIKGALTKIELDYYKAYAKKMALPTDNIGNKLVYGANGLALEGMALLYEATGDQEILDLMIKHCDYMLYCRNDMPGGDGRIMWTGKQDACWPNKALGDPQEKYASSENGDILGHIYFCAYLILLSQDLLDTPAPASDKLTDWGSTYRDRALKFIEMCDETMDTYMSAYFVTEDLKLCFPSSEEWKAIPNVAVGSGFPVNQQMMALNGYQKAAECYGVLDINPEKRELFLKIVQTSINWQEEGYTIKTMNVDGVEVEYAQWPYQVIGSTLDDFGHTGFTLQEFYKLYESQLFLGVDESRICRFLNACKYIMFDPETKTVSHKVDGSGNRVNAAKAGWVLSSIIDPDFYHYMCSLGGNTQTDVGLMGHFLFTKSKLFGTEGFTPQPIDVAKYGGYTPGGSTGLAERPSAAKVTLLSPVRDLLYVETSMEVTKIKVIDLNGLVLINQGFAEITPVAHLANGIYLVQLETAEGKVITCKIVKE